MIRTPPPKVIGGYFVIVTSSPLKKLTPNLMRAEVNNASGGDLWLQLHWGNAVPANGAVPLVESIIVQAGFTNTENFIPSGFSVPRATTTAGPTGLVLVLSTTRATLTAATTADSDITAYVEEWEPRIPEQYTVAGDLTTAVNALQVWADAAGPKSLRTVRVINNAVTDKYIVGYAVDAPLATSVIQFWRLVLANGGAALLDFGSNSGFSPRQFDTAERNGMTIWEADNLTPGNQTAVASFNIEAEYVG